VLKAPLASDARRPLQGSGALRALADSAIGKLFVKGSEIKVSQNDI